MFRTKKSPINAGAAISEMGGGSGGFLNTSTISPQRRPALHSSATTHIGIFIQFLFLVLIKAALLKTKCSHLFHSITFHFQTTPYPKSQRSGVLSVIEVSFLVKPNASPKQTCGAAKILSKAEVSKDLLKPPSPPVLPALRSLMRRRERSRSVEGARHRQAFSHLRELFLKIPLI